MLRVFSSSEFDAGFSHPLLTGGIRVLVIAPISQIRLSALFGPGWSNDMPNVSLHCIIPSGPTGERITCLSEKEKILVMT